MRPSVLIVDDSLTVRMDLEEAFAAADFDIRLCAAATTARRALRERRFDLVVLDVLLPDGGGLELLRELRQDPATAELPILLLSSEVEVSDRIRGLQTGASDYVGKPYDRAYLIARARELVRRIGKRGGGEGATLVLVVDDSAAVRQQLRTALEEGGFAVIEAATGEEGLQIAFDRRPAAAIIDGLLPGIDGASVVRQLRGDAVLRRIPCILLTSSDEPVGELRALEEGADAYVRKDEGLEIVLVRLRALLRAGPAAAVTDAASLLGPKRILAVDDSMTYLQELAAQLRQEGYEVVLATSGEEALRLLAVQPVDCVLLDLLMPGMSGQQACQAVKADPSLRDIPLIILSAREERAAMIEGIDAGADDYVPKSSDFEVLRARLRAQLRRRQFEHENRVIREQLLHREIEAAEAKAARQLAELRAEMVVGLERKNAELEAANSELEAFSYSVSHDLRAPLRAIRGFGEAIRQSHRNRLDADGRQCLDEILAGARRMGDLIDALLALSQVTRAELHREEVDLTALARELVEDLTRAEPQRRVETVIRSGLQAWGDTRLLRVVLHNLVGNAWKFTAPCAAARIEIGALAEAAVASGFFVRDNGVGFNPKYAERLFRPFQRLHSDKEFEGTGIGLATVRRIVQRHGGRVWAVGEAGKGVTVSFTITPRGA